MKHGKLTIQNSVARVQNKMWRHCDWSCYRKRVRRWASLSEPRFHALTMIYQRHVFEKH